MVIGQAANLNVIFVLAFIANPKQLPQDPGIQPGILVGAGHGVGLAAASLAISEDANVVASAKKSKATENTWKYQPDKRLKMT